MDREVTAYFDRTVPIYNVKRLERTVEIINLYRAGSRSLLEIGCGTGSALEFIKSRTGMDELCGIDVSARSLDEAKKRVGCETVSASILDKDLHKKIDKRYDFVLISSVLHHLVGKTRSESRKNALFAVSNALRLVNKGGFLIVGETTFKTEAAMTALFYVKRLTTKISSKRIHLGGSEYNIGAPVVSFYSNDQVLEMIRSAGETEIVDTHISNIRPRLFWQLFFITERADATFTAKRL
ncbi:MAG: class I SAM-dependent methyltransferase [Candidatus Omnitrophota bacterium]